MPKLTIRTEVPLQQNEQDAVDRFLWLSDAESFRDLFHAMVPRVVCYFRTRGCGRELAEDLTQDVMLTVYNQSHRLREKELFRPWLFKIVKNALLQHVRRSGRELHTVALDAGRHAGVQGNVLAQCRFNEWMAWLPPAERHIMTLRYVEGLEYHEIAAMLEMPTGTVQWKVFHSTRKLAARFRESAV